MEDLCHGFDGTQGSGVSGEGSEPKKLASFNSEVEADLQCTKTGFCFVFFCIVI